MVYFTTIITAAVFGFGSRVIEDYFGRYPEANPLYQLRNLQEAWVWGSVILVVSFLLNWFVKLSLRKSVWLSILWLSIAVVGYQVEGYFNNAYLSGLRLQSALYTVKSVLLPELVAAVIVGAASGILAQVLAGKLKANVTTQQTARNLNHRGTEKVARPKPG